MCWEGLRCWEGYSVGKGPMFPVPDPHGRAGWSRVLVFGCKPGEMGAPSCCPRCGAAGRAAPLLAAPLGRARAGRLWAGPPLRCRAQILVACPVSDESLLFLTNAVAAAKPVPSFCRVGRGQAGLSCAGEGWGKHRAEQRDCWRAQPSSEKSLAQLVKLGSRVWIRTEGREEHGGHCCTS